jgi:hypothetical protein
VTALPWHKVNALALVRSPSGRVNLVADIRMDEGDRFDVLLVDSSHNRREMNFSAFDTVEVINNEALPATFSLLLRFPDTHLMGSL